ncbi:hypothetical protein PGT21_010639 [Puccinia graminis f. sp. tritici]|uniref:Uncharacterized protein n=1 Tax=Puccinia graminis f. sp. tritici TaxID=56615 RepID=A0A5B0N9Y6_PUCGR|nr:hypothetical protein PGT21_010639 [Puccinia graminis f. sp. tritici]
MKRINAKDSSNPVNPTLNLTPSSITQSNPPSISPTLNPSITPTSTHTLNPIPPKPKNPSAAKAPTGSTSLQATAKSTNSSGPSTKHPLSLDEVATSAEKHCQSAKQAKDLAAILGAKTNKAYMERTIATNAAIRRKAEKDEETATIIEKALKADAEGNKTQAVSLGLKSDSRTQGLGGNSRCISRG